MKRIISVLCLFCLSAFAQVADKPTPAAASPAASSGLQRRVAVLVCATDHAGHPVEGLAKNQISVLDNQQSGEVLDIASANQLPLDLGIVLLASQGSFAQQQAAAVDLIHKVLRPNVDKAFVVTAGGSKPWPNPHLDWQTDPAAMEKNILSLDKSAGLPDPFGFKMSTDSAGSSRLTIQTYQQTYAGSNFSVFNILWSMMKSDARPARRAVVIFRDAWAHSPGFSSRYEKVVDAQHKEVIQQAQHIWTSFYVIGLEAPAQTPANLTQSYMAIQSGDASLSRQYDEDDEKARNIALNAGRSNLQRFAEETGGAIWWSTKKNFSDAVANIAGALAGQYAVTYAVPVDPAAGPEHLLLVKANDSNTHIAAQKVYFSRQAQPQQQPATAKQPQ